MSLSPMQAKLVNILKGGPMDAEDIAKAMYNGLAGQSERNCVTNLIWSTRHRGGVAIHAERSGPKQKAIYSLGEG